MATPLTASRAPRDPYKARPPKCEDCGTKVSQTNWSGMHVHAGRWLCRVKGPNREESCYEKSVRRAVEDLQSERRREVDIWVSNPPAGLHSLHDSIHYTGKRFVHGMLDAQGVPAMKPRAVEHLNRVEYDSRPKEAPMPRDWLTVDQVAVLLGGTYDQAHELVKSKRLRHRRPFGPYQIPDAALLEYAAASGYTPDDLATLTAAIAAMHRTFESGQ